MKNAWMVRSGGGDYIELFESGLVAIGFGTPMDLTGLGRKESKAKQEAARRWCAAATNWADWRVAVSCFQGAK